MSIVWSLSGVIAYVDGSVKGFEVVHDRQQDLRTGPDVSTVPEIVKMFTDLDLPTKAPIPDPSIRDITFRFCVIDALTNNVTVEIGGTENYIVKDTFYDYAFDYLSNDSFFLSVFADFTGQKFNGMYYLESFPEDASKFPYESAPRSLCFWVKPFKLVENRALSMVGLGVSKEDEDHFTMVYNPSTTDPGSMGLGTGLQNVIFPYDHTKLINNHWNFVAATVDPEGNLSLYMNGDAYNDGSIYSSGNEFFRVGLGFGTNTGLRNLFVGDISHVSWFDKCLSSELVNKIYQLGRVDYDSIPFDFYYGYTTGPFIAERTIDSVEALQVASGGVSDLKVIYGGGEETLDVDYYSHSFNTIYASNGEVLEFRSYNNVSGLSHYYNITGENGLIEDQVGSANLHEISMKIDLKPQLALRGQEVTFGIISDVRPSNIITDPKYLWTFDDGSTSTNKSPKRSFRRTGAYEVSLTADSSFTTKNLIYVVKERIVEPLNGTIDKAELVYDATFEYDYVNLNVDDYERTGGVRFDGVKYPLGSIFNIEFEFYAYGDADAVYFYFNCLDHPFAEDQGYRGYSVAFSEYFDRIFIYYDAQELISIVPPFNLGNGTWRKASISFVNGNFSVKVNGIELINHTDTERYLKYTNWGIGGRTGGFKGVHRVRNVKVSY